MTQQSDSTRQKISAILSQIGMTDEELYQLLYGRKEQVDIDIALPQLMDEHIWLETEHSEEELAHMSQQIAVLEQLVNTPPEGAALAALETLLEGHMIPDEARGFLLKKYFKNWRQGMSQFLAFLAFSKLQQLALSLANLTAPNLVAQFDNTKNRPQDRKLLADFILKQVEQPLPPIISILAEAGAILGPTGSLEYHQPLTAVLLQQAPEKIAQMLNLLTTTQEIPLPENTTTSPAEVSKTEQAQQKDAKTAALLNKLVVLDRVETLIANQQALQQQPEQQLLNPTEQQQAQQQQQAAPRRSSGSRRRAQLREAMEREAKERAIRDQQQRDTDSNTRSSNRQEAMIQQQRAGAAQLRQQQINIVRNNSFIKTSSKKTTTPASPTPVPPPATIQPEQEQAFKGLFNGMPLDALKGLTATNVDREQLGKTKSNLPKDNSPIPLNKPEPKLER